MLLNELSDLGTTTTVDDIALGERPMTAVALDGRVRLRDLWLPWPIVSHSSHCVTSRTPDGCDVHVFALGAIVVDGRDDIDAELAKPIVEATECQTLPDTQETYTIVIDEEQHTGPPVVGWDRVLLRQHDASALEAVALLMAQSAALERYEGAIESMVEESLSLARELVERGRPPWRRGLPVRRVAKLAEQRLELERWFFLLDRPEATWEDPSVAGLYDALFENLELRERHEALLHKLASVETTLKIIIDAWEGRRARFIEWAIVVLIALEIGFALLEWI